MRILQLFVFFSPDGGATVDLLYKLSRALAQRGHEVEIYTSDFKLDRRYIDSLPEVKVRPFRCLFSAGQLYLAPGLVGEVKRHIKDFDIVRESGGRYRAVTRDLAGIEADASIQVEFRRKPGKLPPIINGIEIRAE